MTAQVQHKKGRVRVNGEMTVYAAESLKQDLLATLSRHSRATLLDLSGVTEFDTAGLQLLLIARAHAANEGRQLSLVDPSSVVLEALELCQMTGLLPAAGTEQH
jgi:anti-sigma B factor antagonist